MNKVSPIPKRPVDETLAVPLYHQVYLILREHIRSGVYRAGSLLPSEAALCDEFDVSRITVKRAMRDLAAEGIIERHRGKGTFVTGEAWQQRQPDALDDLVQNVEAIGASTDVRQVSSTTVEATAEIAERLGLTAGDAVHRSSHLRLANGQPLAVIVTYVPRYASERLDPKTEHRPMLLRLADAGFELERADQEITATLAEPVVADQLGSDVGAPLLKLTRLVFNGNDRPIEWLTALYRADRYAVRTSLTHDSLGQKNAWKPAE